MKYIALIALLFWYYEPVFCSEKQESEDSSNTLLTQNKPFNREMMQLPGYSPETSGLTLLDPARFSMSQSYSTTMGYTQAGSYSYGLYLNTLSYQIFNPLTFSIDLGIYTPFHSSGSYSSGTSSGNLEQMGSLVIPRIGLDYKPTENMLISIQYLNINDAYKAYGPFGYLRSPFSR
jgi:hypothetical protein